jgi:hypothetical protein
MVEVQISPSSSPFKRGRDSPRKYWQILNKIQYFPYFEKKVFLVNC